MFCVLLLLLLLFYNKMTNRSLSFPYISMEFFINFLALGYNGTYKFKYTFFEFLESFWGTRSSIWNYFT
jgi:hypothetical protein